RTGQIGGLLLRKYEKVRQGYRAEFVAGQRAVSTARHDFSTLTEAAAVFSSHIYDVPQQVRKSIDEIRSLRKQREQSLEELAAAPPQPALVFAQSAGQPYDMAALLKQIMAPLGGRGGGSKDLAQGGLPQPSGLSEALAAAAKALIST